MSKKRISNIFILCFVILLCITTVNANGTSNQKVTIDKNTIWTYGDINNSGTKISVQSIAGEDTLVLPSAVLPENTVIFSNIPKSVKVTVSGDIGKSSFVSGEPINLLKLCSDKDFRLTFTLDGEEKGYSLRFLFSKEIPAVYLSSENKEEQGRSWVDSSEKKTNKAKGSMVMQKSDGNIVYDGALTQIKGRGNSTWTLPKKPYQIKLETKADLLETSVTENKSKTWVLLANYIDNSGIRNIMAFDIAKALGMNVVLDCISVDLYYDGEYRGNYTLSEKAEVGAGRVSIVDMEEKNEEANKGVNLEELKTDTGVTSNGATYTYCVGMKSPEDITGGYLLEMDYKERALEEVCYFCTKRGIYVVVKSPEYASKEEMDYISSLYQEYEDAVYNGGINPKTGKKYSDYIDARSVACYYLVNELSKARDCFNSSAYLHIDEGKKRFVMGPLWDYDMSFGKGSYDIYCEYDSPNGISALNSQMGLALLKIDDFYTLTKQIYLNELYPMVQEVLVGDTKKVSDDGSLYSVKHYADEIFGSLECNTLMWYGDKDNTIETDKMISFIHQRSNVLKNYFETLNSIEDLPSDRYYDVLPNEWYYGDVSKVTRDGILRGVGNGFFRPEYNVKRSQAVQVIFNMSGVEDVVYEPEYLDVPKGSWYTDAVVWANQNKLIYGYPDKTFRPDSDVTREEFIELLYRFSGSPQVDINKIEKFSDAHRITLKEAMEWSVENGILVGYGNYINPKGYMTRAELSAILVRYYDKFVE